MGASSQALTLLVRRAAVNDAADVAALLAELGYPNPQQDIESRIREHHASRQAAVFVAESGGKIVGLASFQQVPLFHAPGYLGRITSFIVSDSHRRRGIGRALVLAIEEFAWKNGCERIEVTSGDGRTDAHAFYERLGFAPVSRRFIKVK